MNKRRSRRRLRSPWAFPRLADAPSPVLGSERLAVVAVERSRRQAFGEESGGLGGRPEGRLSAVELRGRRLLILPAWGALAVAAVGVGKLRLRVLWRGAVGVRCSAYEEGGQTCEVVSKFPNYLVFILKKIYFNAFIINHPSSEQRGFINNLHKMFVFIDFWLLQMGGVIFVVQIAPHCLFRRFQRNGVRLKRRPLPSAGLGASLCWEQMGERRPSCVSRMPAGLSFWTADADLEHLRKEVVVQTTSCGSREEVVVVFPIKIKENQILYGGTV